MASTPQVFKTSTLTRLVNEIKSPNSWLRNTFFRRVRLFSTPEVEMTIRRRGRRMAAFVKKGGAGIMIPSHQDERFTVEPAHLRVKIPLEAEKLADERQGAMAIFASTAEQAGGIRATVAEHVAHMGRDMDESEEWLASQAITGIISYVNVVEDDLVQFTIDYRRSATHNITLTGADLWTAGTAKIRADFLTASKLVERAVGLNVTDVILGENAADAFLENAAIKTILDNRRIDIGRMLLMNQIDTNTGALFLGTFFNSIRVWMYTRQTTHPDGTTIDLIRPDYAEFIANTPANEFEVLYGGISDTVLANRTGGAPARLRRFSKSWEIDDPAGRMFLTASNPLPVTSRPDSTVSMKVV